MHTFISLLAAITHQCKFILRVNDSWLTGMNVLMKLVTENWSVVCFLIWILVSFIAQIFDSNLIWRECYLIVVKSILPLLRGFLFWCLVVRTSDPRKKPHKRPSRMLHMLWMYAMIFWFTTCKGIRECGCSKMLTNVKLWCIIWRWSTELTKVWERLR